MRDAIASVVRGRGGTATGAMSSEGYTRSEEDKTRGSVSERIARLRQSLSGDKLSGMAGPSLGGLATTAKRAAEEAKDAFGAPDGVRISYAASEAELTTALAAIDAFVNDDCN